jgi:hypothetical protein
MPTTQPASRRITSLVRDKRPQYTNTLGDAFLLDIVHNSLDRLVRFGPFLNEELRVGANNMRAQRSGSEIRCRVARVRALPENVRIARMKAACSMGERVSYHINKFSAQLLSSKRTIGKRVHTIDLTVPRWLKNPTEIATASRARDKSLITRCSTLSMDPDISQLSIDGPTLPHDRVVRDIEQLSECFTGIDIGFVFPSFGLICFGNCRRVGIRVGILGVEWVWSLVEETMLDTMGNEVAICLCPVDCVVVLVEV